MRNTRNFFKVIKDTCEKPTASITLNYGSLTAFSIRSEMRQENLILSLSFYVALEVFTGAIMQ
jgi:hypothetical protein